MDHSVPLGNPSERFSYHRPCGADVGVGVIFSSLVFGLNTKTQTQIQTFTIFTLFIPVSLQNLLSKYILFRQNIYDRLTLCFSETKYINYYFKFYHKFLFFFLGSKVLVFFSLSKNTFFLATLFLFFL